MASRFEQLSHEELLQEANRLQQALDKEKKVSAAYCEELRRQREQNLVVVSTPAAIMEAGLSPHHAH